MKKKLKKEFCLEDDFYVCPQHITQGGYEECCACGDWDKDNPEDWIIDDEGNNKGRMCSEFEGDN